MPHPDTEDPKDRFEGIFAALVTPLTADDQLDLDALAAHVEFLVSRGVHGLAPLGSTGEYYALTPYEREAVVRTTVEAAAGRVPVVVGTNAGSTRDVIELSRQAEQLGAAGLLLAPPYYSLPAVDELCEHFREVAAAVNIPIMLYNYPGRTGVDMTPEVIERLAGLEPVRYVKESSGQVGRISQVRVRCAERITVFCGCDTAALESFVLGAAGWVSGVVNFLAEECVQLFELAVRRQDYVQARDLYYRLLPLLTMAEESGHYTQVCKAGCALSGRDVGPPRAPLRPLCPEKTAQLEALLAGLRQPAAG